MHRCRDLRRVISSLTLIGRVALFCIAVGRGSYSSSICGQHNKRKSKCRELPPEKCRLTLWKANWRCLDRGIMIAPKVLQEDVW
ncbi:hypothetical protein K469DRAFT_720183 [Zopfia rhizophila CBS 207.26]|uniref:Uncharacterized protein n=1 Tax=Zopfia rhizophila CBS 207.26 TaxID=1314779 RepID=A0A6A6EHM0_9PEZI|nr:hypothetical protein K469DRAFT_720183 [Zopfia rhizophila CBS 207.26]